MNETFRKWKSTYACDEDTIQGYNIRDMQAAFLAGATMMKEKAAEIAKHSHHSGDCCCDWCLIAYSSAAAILKMEVK